MTYYKRDIRICLDLLEGIQLMKPPIQVELERLLRKSPSIQIIIIMLEEGIGVL